MNVATLIQIWPNKASPFQVKLSEMPKVEIPERIEKQFSIMKPYPVPEPCQKHVYQIILPSNYTIIKLYLSYTTIPPYFYLNTILFVIYMSFNWTRLKAKLQSRLHM